MDNPIKLTALSPQLLTPRAQLFSGYRSLLRAWLCLDERLPGSCGEKCLRLIRAIFSELRGNWYSSVSAVTVPSQRRNERWVRRDLLTALALPAAQAPLCHWDVEMCCFVLFPSLSLWTHVEGHCTSVLEVISVCSAWCCGKHYPCENTQPLEGVMWTEILCPSAWRSVWAMLLPPARRYQCRAIANSRAVGARGAPMSWDFFS